MRFLHSILLLSLFGGCATKKEIQSLQRVQVPRTAIAAKNLGTIRTPETVKAYPLGRYSDPNFPEEMHERHTLYRREQGAEWNFTPSKLYALPLGPVVATSNPSPSYYVKTNAEQINAQQKAYAEALLEQNQALKKRIDALQQKDSTIHDLQAEIERLRKELDSRPSAAVHAAQRRDPRPIAHTRRFLEVRHSGFHRSQRNHALSPLRSTTTRRSSSRRCGSTTRCPKNSEPCYDAGSRSF